MDLSRPFFVILKERGSYIYITVFLSIEQGALSIKLSYLRGVAYNLYTVTLIALLCVTVTYEKASSYVCSL